MSNGVFDTARQQLGLSYLDLWIDCFALGGRLNVTDLTACLLGQRAISGADHNVIAYALNERFRDRDQDNPVEYYTSDAMPPG